MVPRVAIPFREKNLPGARPSSGDELFSMKTIRWLTPPPTWRLRNGYAPARGRKGLVTPTRPTLGQQTFGHSEVFQ
jgi:hypothetical protein